MKSRVEPGAELPYLGGGGGGGGEGAYPPTKAVIGARVISNVRTD